MTEDGQMDFASVAGGEPSRSDEVPDDRPVESGAGAVEGPTGAPEQEQSDPQSAQAASVVSDQAEPVAHEGVEPKAGVPVDEAGQQQESRRAELPGNTGADAAVSERRQAVSAQQAGLAERRTPRLFFLTNQMNLNGVLGARLLAPRESFHKYYVDLLEVCPGWVPVLTGAPPPSLIERVIAERGAGAPVLVELSESALNGLQPDTPVVYIRAVAFSAVTAIHFPDKKALRGHLARGYKNVHPHEDLLEVSPDLFNSTDCIETTISAPSDTPDIDWLHLDRVRGAISAVIAAANSGEATAVAAGVLGAAQLPEGTFVPPWLRWDEMGSATDVSPSADAFARAGQLIFQTSFRVLARCDQKDSWRPAEVLENIEGQIGASNPGGDAGLIIEKGLHRVRELINVEREFTPFQNPGSPYVAAKSLLMVLLRPDLGQLLDWPAEETGADEATRVAAAALAGCLRGLARESVALRSVVLDDLTAAWAVRTINGHDGPLGTPSFVAADDKTTLSLDGHELRRSTPLAPDPIPLYEAIAPTAREAVRITVSRHLGWPVVVRVRIPESSEVQQENSLITITTSQRIDLEPSVEEEAFLERLRATTGRDRREVNAMLRRAG
ncbi:hypothetical protein [[Mycobacterium] nativiensis]|uniref:Uncharacterized protein n=1 Tax=[Mycobacterium] nativiensis TaxID=2855503 RepID=A0ABU5XVS2_9MYCO|nr:hypothetical protein [Mycolicibacter sp. MYC340]MEB3032087.1 hypothetical protein [Mycolicibacter sp. MYC340]